MTLSVVTATAVCLAFRILAIAKHAADAMTSHSTHLMNSSSVIVDIIIHLFSTPGGADLAPAAAAQAARTAMAGMNSVIAFPLDTISVSFGLFVLFSISIGICCSIHSSRAL